MNEKDLIEIKLKYSDGEEKTLVKQGLVVEFETDKKDEDLVNTTFHMLNISGVDMRMVVMSIVQLGVKLGMFDGEEID